MLRFRGFKFRLLGLSIWSVLASGVAHAQDLPCNEPFSSNDFITKMNTADAALAEFNIEVYRSTLSDVQDLLPCTHDRIHPNLITRYARQMAMSYFLDQDEMTMAQWGTLAMVNVELPWPATLEDETHPFRDSMSFIEEPWINGPEGAGLNPPKGGAILLDGMLLM